MHPRLTWKTSSENQSPNSRIRSVAAMTSTTARLTPSALLHLSQLAPRFRELPNRQRTPTSYRDDSS